MLLWLRVSVMTPGMLVVTAVMFVMTAVMFVMTAVMLVMTAVTFVMTFCWVYQSVMSARWYARESKPLLQLGMQEIEIMDYLFQRFCFHWDWARWDFQDSLFPKKIR